MFSFDRLKYDKIPIWENCRRIEYLTLFRDLIFYCYGGEGVLPYLPDSPLIPILKSGSMNPSQGRSAVNERIPRARQMIELSGIKLRRICSCTDQDRPPTIEIDVLEQVFDLIRLGVSEARATDVVDESIGVYKRDQKKARGRTWHPFFWAVWIFAWIAEFPTSLFSRVSGIDQGKAERSRPGRAITALVQASLWIFALIGALAGLFYLLECLGFKDAVLHWFGLK